jgi:hypothetical protein
MTAMFCLQFCNFAKLQNYPAHGPTIANCCKASFVENVVTRVMECYKSPCSNLEPTQAEPTTIQQDERAERNNPTGTSYVKVKQLRDNIKSSHKFLTIRQLYLLQCSLQTFCALVFFVIDVSLTKGFKETIICELTDDIHMN